MIDFYKMRVGYFYGTDVEKVSFENVDEEIKKRVNTAVSSQTNKVKENLIAMEEDKLTVEPPLAVAMGNYFKVIISTN